MSADDDEKARKRRAEELRSTIRDAESGAKPGRAPTPREITDEAARKARDEANKISPEKDRSNG
ncbi:hypothetical protein ABID59_005910 [Bradyrhizobium sp. S3.3.6]|uniref:Uncharacterized protein n=1 Tax=Bradyrhizobium cytisi TaxID=515489 RepID=A0A5S4WZ60_9BRAD|nr:hypothetical protein [Bradyrhizobium cytisi]TYL86931.1 hypothetical protein FXB38_06740 [Bradyrhizobium cytisi]